jgi:hypothetical protein
VSALQVVLLVLPVLVFLGLALLPVRRRAREQQAALAAELGDAARRVANARGLGLESRGARQVRGNGWLVLTPDELRFRQWVPDRETCIPLAGVTAVATPRWWLGKSVGSRLLCVRWRDADGTEDAMAWQVRDLDGWLAALGGRREADGEEGAEGPA